MAEGSDGSVGRRSVLRLAIGAAAAVAAAGCGEAVRNPVSGPAARSSGVPAKLKATLPKPASAESPLAAAVPSLPPIPTGVRVPVLTEPWTAPVHGLTILIGIFRRS